MRINEITLNEGWYDDAKAKVAGGVNAVKQSGPGQFVGHHAGELGKIGSDIGSAFGGITDRARAFAYKNLGGMGKDKGLGAATRQTFINRFVGEYNRYMMSAKKGGMTPPSTEQYVRDYINRNGWTASEPEIEEIVSGADNNVNKLANSMFVLASKQSYDKRGGILNRNQANTQQDTPKKTGGMSPTASGDDVQLNPVSDKIIKNIDHMLGGSNADDLEKIAVAAMNKLNAINPAKYSALRKQIMNPSAHQTQQAEPGGRIEPTFESKSRKISNRNK
jgi:hypothetical protein